MILQPSGFNCVVQPLVEVKYLDAEPGRDGVVVNRVVNSSDGMSNNGGVGPNPYRHQLHLPVDPGNADAVVAHRTDDSGHP